VIPPPIDSQAEARWRDLVTRRPELADAVALQRHLVARTSELADLLECRSPSDGPPIDAALANIARGVPALAGATWEISAPAAAPSLDDFCALLAEGGAGDAATHLREALRSGRVRPDTLIAASLARNQHAIGCGAAQLDLSADLVWLVGELGAAPVAVAARERLMSNPTIAAAVTDWSRGYCPFCGSWPAFAESSVAGAIAANRTLRCSFCAGGWELQQSGCIYCGADDLKIGVGPPEGSGHRIEACDACRYYLKSLSVESPTPPLLLPVEDLATIDLDEAAAEAEYTRPPLPDVHA
jgi:FdhE protein